ncbi:MAG: hypothetical protein AAGF12_19440 [Myxococcota bacterium]
MDELLRFLEVVQSTLGADDARVEVGGRDPVDGNLIWVHLDARRRVVALFDEPPPERKLLEGKLLALVDSFLDTSRPAPAEGRAGLAELERALEVVRRDGGAQTVFVIDETSPELWARSGGEIPTSTAIAQEVEAHRSGADAFARTDVSEDLRQKISSLAGGSIDDWDLYLRAAAAMTLVQRQATAARPHGRLTHREANLGLLGRSFANIYWLVAVFDGEFSALHCEAAMLRALPFIEQRVVGLPPRVPPDGTGRGKLRLV